MAYTALIHELEDELGVSLPRNNMSQANSLIAKVLRESTDEITLPILTLRIVRALIPLFGEDRLREGSQVEYELVQALQPFVVDLIAQ